MCFARPRRIASNRPLSDRKSFTGVPRRTLLKLNGINGNSIGVFHNDPTRTMIFSAILEIGDENLSELAGAVVSRQVSPTDLLSP
jgi:hypothetical protein